MIPFKNLYRIDRPNNVLDKVVPWFEQYIPVIPTNNIDLENMYLVVGPWKYSEEEHKIFDQGHYIHYDKGYFFHGKVPDYHRLTYQSLQEANIFDCDDKRLNQFNIEIKPWKRTGDYILIVAPDEFPVQYYTPFQTEFDWVMWLKHELRKYTDRKIFYRFKEKRKQRGDDPLSLYLNDAWAVVTHQSLACIESICEGVPVFNLAPSCCDNMALQDISKIEEPFYPENRYEWLKSLSYGQFTVEEIMNGFALETLQERYK